MDFETVIVQLLLKDGRLTWQINVQLMQFRYGNFKFCFIDILHSNFDEKISAKVAKHINLYVCILMHQKLGTFFSLVICVQSTTFFS